MDVMKMLAELRQEREQIGTARAFPKSMVTNSRIKS